MDKYFGEVKSKISAVQIVKALKKTIDVLKVDIPMSEPDLLTLTLNVSMKEDVLKQELKDEIKDIRVDFYRLFDDMCPNLREFTMYPC